NRSRGSRYVRLATNGDVFSHPRARLARPMLAVLLLWLGLTSPAQGQPTHRDTAPSATPVHLGSWVDYSVCSGCVPTQVLALDLLNNGGLDLVVAYNSDIAVFLGDDSGSFQSTPIVSATNIAASRIAGGDFNKDFIPDLAVVDYVRNL